MRKCFILMSTIYFLLSCSPSQQKTTEQAVIETPKQALESLKSGNERFVMGKTNKPNQDMARVVSLTDGQAPYAAIIACSDSRVPVELLFDQGFGDLFVIRTAGNTVIDKMTQGSVDYAVNHLGVKVVLVLGHTSCGAITGVLATKDVQAGDAEVEDDGDVPAMLNLIGDQIPEYKGKGKACCLDKAIQANVDVQIAKMIKLDHISDKINSGNLILTSAIYDVSNGKITFKPVVADATITEGLKFCESTYPYDGGLLIANFGTETLNPLNTEGKGYIAYNKDGKTSVFIPTDGNLSAPKGMLEKDGYLYICDVNKVVVYNLKDLKATPQVIPFNEGELFLNDIALSNNNLIVSVTNTGNLFKIDLADKANLKADLWCNVVGANGVLVKDNQIFVASYPADGVTTENNVVYVIDDFNAPKPQKLINRAGQYDGLALSKDGKTLYATNWSPAEVISIDLATKEIKNIDIKEKLIGPADISIVGDVLFIPDLPNSRVIVKAL